MSQRGVTLIELIIVIVALTAGVALLGRAFVEPARSVADNENIQIAWQVAQACADHALGRKRISGTSGAFANITGANPCPAFNGITPGWAVADTTGAGVCTGIAGAANCTQVTVTAAKGGYTATLVFVVVDY